MDVTALKQKLADVPGIDTLTITQVGGRHVATFNGLTAAVDPFASEDQLLAAIRSVANLKPAEIPAVQPMPAAPAPAPAPAAAAPAPKAPAPAPGGFAAMMKAIVDEAKAVVAQSQVDGLAKVRAAAGRLHEVAAHTTRVTDNMAQSASDQADAALAELGQISNLPPEGEA